MTNKGLKRLNVSQCKQSCEFSKPVNDTRWSLSCQPVPGTLLSHLSGLSSQDQEQVCCVFLFIYLFYNCKTLGIFNLSVTSAAINPCVLSACNSVSEGNKSLAPLIRSLYYSSISIFSAAFGNTHQVYVCCFFPAAVTSRCEANTQSNFLLTAQRFFKSTSILFF